MSGDVTRSAVTCGGWKGQGGVSGRSSCFLDPFASWAPQPCRNPGGQFPKAPAGSSGVVSPFLKGLMFSFPVGTARPSGGLDAVLG